MDDISTSQFFPKNFEYYKQFLVANLQGQTDFPDEDILREFEIYKRDIDFWSEKASSLDLDSFSTKSDGGFVYNYPNIHPFYQIILDLIKNYNIKSICDIGSGIGMAAKYIAAECPDVKITCVDSTPKIIELLGKNLSKETTLLEPKIDVDADIVLANALALPFENQSFDLVLTNTTLMQFPFYMAIQALMEIRRVTKGFVLHVENKHEGIFLGHHISNNNLLNVDYKKFYGLCYTRCLSYSEMPYPGAANNTAMIYFGKTFESVL